MRFSGLALLTMACATGPASSLPQTGSSQNQQSTETVRIGVFSLFKPKELVLRAVRGSDLIVDIDGHSQTVSQESSPIHLYASGGQIEMRSRNLRFQGVSLRAHRAGPSGTPSASFVLEVPGKLRRLYSGTLEIQAHGQILEAVVTMPVETAVASIVAAESPPGEGIEALKAQAVAARSFLIARQAAHADFDFCDTTHCQFFRSPPAEKEPAAKAARATAGLVLTWHDDGVVQEQVLAAMYARSCGGRTRTLREIGIVSRGYPYYKVHCVYCSHHPEAWRRDAAIAAGSDAASKPRSSPATERERLAFNRIHGWGAIPSLGNGIAGDDGKRSIVGRGDGHGLGLCQLGAADMARQGADFARILAHYYPNTRLTQMPRP